MLAGGAFILSGVRTPIGARGGALAEVPDSDLGAICIREALKRTGIGPEEVDEVIMGNVVTTGPGPIPARQAAIKAGVPFAAGATAVNKGCGSGLKAVMPAAQAIRLGEASVVVAGGMENMSRAPDLLDDQETMGSHGDRCAQKYGLTREDQNQFAVRSFTRARQAIAERTFKDEIVPVCVADKNPVLVIHEDEGPRVVR
jgi:acetyl-CoA C-acetyltransferase